MTATARDYLLGLTKRRYKLVEIGAYHFRIQNLTEEEKSEFEAAVMNDQADFSLAKMKRQRRRLIILCLVDDDGSRILKPEDERELRNVDGAVTSRLFEECRKHCGFDKNDIEELAGNSLDSRAVSSRTDSRCDSESQT